MKSGADLLLIGKGVRDVLPYSLHYWNDSAQKNSLGSTHEQ